MDLNVPLMHRSEQKKPASAMHLGGKICPLVICGAVGVPRSMPRGKGSLVYYAALRRIRGDIEDIWSYIT